MNTSLQDGRNVHHDVVSAIGCTPLIRLNQLTASLEHAEIWVKLERCNPGGSIKDRIALQMVLDAEEEGLLRHGGTIIENTSGNTGVGLAMVAAQRGYRCIFTMSDKMSREKQAMLRALGAEVVLCPADASPEDPRSYYSVAARMATEIEGSWYANQYANMGNPRAHLLQTGPEIWGQAGGRMTHFIATMGTGGTISGCSAAFRVRAEAEDTPMPRIVGVDVKGSILKEWFDQGSIGEAHAYLVEGFGEDFIPGTTDFDVIDEIRQVDDRACFTWARMLARSEGILAGGSAGGCLSASMDIAREMDEAGTPAVIVALLPDSGSNYLSTFHDDQWFSEHGFAPEDPG